MEYLSCLMRYANARFKSSLAFSFSSSVPVLAFIFALMAFLIFCLNLSYASLRISLPASDDTVLFRWIYISKAYLSPRSHTLSYLIGTGPPFFVLTSNGSGLCSFRGGIGSPFSFWSSCRRTVLSLYRVGQFLLYHAGQLLVFMLE